MKKRITKGSERSRAVYSELEAYARRKVQEFMQDLLGRRSHGVFRAAEVGTQ